MQVSEILENRRLRAVRERKVRLERLYEDHPKLREIKDQQRVVTSKILLESLNAGACLENLKKEMDQLRSDEKLYLKSHRIPFDYDEVRYFCKDCKDTGFVNGKSCHCRNNLKLREMYKQSSIPEMLEKENFSTFNMNMFNKDRQENEPLSPYEHIKEIVEDLKSEYIPHFGSNSPSLYFYGPVGTGKTFLANCIAKSLIDKGCSVYYRTAYDLINFLSEYTFSYSKESMQNERDFIFSCDLLVIDDLGTEFASNKSKSDIFEVINSRMIGHKPTLISSNLGPEDLGNYYDDRVKSRIGNEYILYEFFGPDLRRLC